ncbi:11601_t:CDS:2, partial [Scutellospora calospora]
EVEEEVEAEDSELDQEEENKEEKKRDIDIRREYAIAKKENRRSIIVSKFILEECDQLKLSKQEMIMHLDVPVDARCYLMPGKNQEGFWTVDNLLEQIRDKVILIFETKFSNATAIFAFDNSTNYAAYAEDALITTRINLKPRGNQPKM